MKQKFILFSPWLLKSRGSESQDDPPCFCVVRFAFAFSVRALGLQV